MQNGKFIHVLFCNIFYYFLSFSYCLVGHGKSSQRNHDAEMKNDENCKAENQSKNSSDQKQVLATKASDSKDFPSAKTKASNIINISTKNSQTHTKIEKHSTSALNDSACVPSNSAHALSELKPVTKDECNRNGHHKALTANNVTRKDKLATLCEHHMDGVDSKTSEVGQHPCRDKTKTVWSDPRRRFHCRYYENKIFTIVYSVLYLCNVKSRLLFHSILIHLSLHLSRLSVIYKKEILLQVFNCEI